jgi:iron(III) transport system permease protein
VEAALLFKNNWLKILTMILFPLNKNGLIIGWIIAFILCLGELGTTLLVVPPGKASLTIRIYTLMHYGANKLVAALCIILICMIILPSIGLGLLAGKGSLKNKIIF